VLGAAGGVGSIMIQLAKALTRLRVIATASRDESADWARRMGADDVINHQHLREETRRVAPMGVDYLLSPHSQGNIDTYAAIMRPFGRIAAIDSPPSVDLLPLKEKSITWHWEMMFTRPLYQTDDMSEQQLLLTRAAELVDNASCTPPLRARSTTSAPRDYDKPTETSNPGA
jgi:NADPH:quinone reductase-like Zn-dependent oxidoreductase